MDQPGHYYLQINAFRQQIVKPTHRPAHQQDELRKSRDELNGRFF
jgi:hypothetical protein